MGNVVLLARPSFFIVNEMQSFMKESAYDPKPVKNLEAIKQVSSSSVKGAVISTAVRSDVTESYAEVLQQIRKNHAGIPVMFATLVDFETMAKAIQIKLEDHGFDPHLVPISRKTLSDGKLGQQDTFVVIHKEDITDPERRQIANQILQRHFK